MMNSVHVCRWNGAGHGFNFFNAEKYVIYERNTDFFSGSYSSEWWPYFSLLVASEEYTLDNIYGRSVCLGTLCIVLGHKHKKNKKKKSGNDHTYLVLALNELMKKEHISPKCIFL